MKITIEVPDPEDFLGVPVWDGKSDIDIQFLLRSIRGQRFANKVLKEVYHKLGIFSYHNMIMAVANLARETSIEYSDEPKIDPSTPRIWLNRYYEIYDMLNPKRRDPKFRKEMIEAQKEWLKDPNRY